MYKYKKTTLTATLGKLSADQSHLFTDNHKKYHISLQVNGKTLRTTFQFATAFSELNAIWCIVGDALTGCESFSSFRSMNPDLDTQRAKQLHERCRKFMSFFNQNGLTKADLQEIYSRLA